MSKLATKMEHVSFRDAVNIPSTTYGTFGLYRYPAKFIPHVVAYVLEKYARPKTSVFDPFGGYGTVGTVAKVYGHDYEMWDLNPMLGILHPIATMKPAHIDIGATIKDMKGSREEFIPDWERISNWYEPKFLPFLYKIWGYYHSLEDKKTKMILTIPLLKTTRYFSYDDMQKQKLCRSPLSIKRVESISKSNWKNAFFTKLEIEVQRVEKRLEEYAGMHPKKTRQQIKTKVDVLSENLKQNRDILITSPPYLQSQEYMRQAKLDLFWLGFSESDIKKLAKLEIPYRKVDPCPIYSRTYDKFLKRIKEEHIREAFQRYFWCILGTFGKLQERITDRMFIFVGHSSTRGMAIPLDNIIIEHLSSLGCVHEKTLSDKIVGRQLFDYAVNPASKIRDARTNIENLVILKTGK